MYLNGGMGCLFKHCSPYDHGTACTAQIIDSHFEWRLPKK